MLRHRQRMVQIQADDGRTEANSAGAAREMEREKERRGKEAVVGVCVMLGEPCVLDPDPVRLLDDLRDLGKYLAGRAVCWPLDVIGEAEEKWCRHSGVRHSLFGVRVVRRCARA